MKWRRPAFGRRESPFARTVVAAVRYRARAKMIRGTSRGREGRKVDARTVGSSCGAVKW